MIMSNSREMHMSGCKVTQNKKHCTCSHTSCSRHGVCCDCLSYHFGMGELPGCLFPSDVERTDARSIAKFVKTYQERDPWW